MSGTSITPTLLVIYTEQLEACRVFYTDLGLPLVREQHAGGPVHYAAELDCGLVVELYPADSAERATGRLRLGLAVPAAIAQRIGARTHIDPDGRAVVVTAADPVHYLVTTRRWAEGWELHISDAGGAEIGVTQVEDLSDAERMVQDYLAACDLPPGQIDTHPADPGNTP
ncbi:VOC family protein [Pseudonocardia sp. TMWB2A]|uniref:VOC family protein n=1 Tax=Pseudonocardia sp. TMWB2A TaxID=687430 RepID=UPI00307E25AB